MAIFDLLPALEKLSKEVGIHSEVVYCQRINQFSDQWNISEHSHSFLEILYFIKGEAIVAIGKSNRSVSAGDLIVYPPGFKHKEYIDFSRQQEAVCLGFQLRKNADVRDVICISDLDRKLEWLFIEIHNQFRQKDLDSLVQLKHLLFRYMIQCGQQGNIKEQPLSSRVTEYIHAHYREKMEQRELCELCHVSPSYLNRVFKANLGLTPIEYLNKVRIEEASVLMKKDFLSLEMIGAEVGIADPKYFSRVFKKVTGFTPSQFRRMQRIKR